VSDQNLLRRAAQRAATNGFFLGSLLIPLAVVESLSDDALAARLGCDPANVPAILLCRRPSSEPSAFRADVQRIAERFGADPLLLAEAIRLGQALEALAPSGAEEQGRLLAARDRETGEDEPQ